MAAEKKFKNYGIAFKGLKEGKHLFEYNLSNAFFELFEEPQIETGNLKALVTLQKGSRMMELHFNIEGEVGANCDRCLEEMMVPVKYEGILYVNFGEYYDEPTEEIVVLPHEAHTINVARFMYEFIVVSLPIRHVHPDNDDGSAGCNPEMLERLDQYLIEENDIIPSEEEDDDEPIDPRWEELKKLRNKNNK